MAKVKAPDYDSEGFAGAHQARGMSPAARKYLESKGNLPGPAEASKKPAAEPRQRKPLKSDAEAKPRRKRSPELGQPRPADEAELPRRSRKARTLQARHFRIPLEIDAKLKDLVEYHEGTMVWVICKLIQEEWVRSRRALRRDLPTAEADDPDDGTPEGAPPS